MPVELANPTQAYNAMIEMMQRAFPMFDIHVRVSVDLSKYDVFTDNGNCNKDTSQIEKTFENELPI